MKKLAILTLSLTLVLSQTTFAAGGSCIYVGRLSYPGTQKTYGCTFNSSELKGLLDKYIKSGKQNCGQSQKGCVQSNSGKCTTSAKTPATEETKNTETPTKAPAEKPDKTDKPAETPTKSPSPQTEPTYKEPSTEATTLSPETKPQSAVSDTAQSIQRLVNSQRAANGLKPLSLDSSLNYAANLKAQDMADKNYFDHTSPTYGTPFQMLQRLGISYRAAGENIAKGQKTPEAVMNAWMNSSGHRANILNSSYGKLGVGYVVKNGVTYWVQIFTD